MKAQWRRGTAGLAWPTVTAWRLRRACARARARRETAATGEVKLSSWAARRREGCSHRLRPRRSCFRRGSVRIRPDSVTRPEERNDDRGVAGVLAGGCGARRYRYGECGWSSTIMPAGPEASSATSPEGSPRAALRDSRHEGPGQRFGRKVANRIGSARTWNTEAATELHASTHSTPGRRTLRSHRLPIRRGVATWPCRRGCMHSARRRHPRRAQAR